MDTIDKNEPWKYLWKYDEIVINNLNFDKFRKEQEAETFFLFDNKKTVFIKFQEVFQLTYHDVDTYYLIFKYIGKDPEMVMCNLINQYYIDCL